MTQNPPTLSEMRHSLEQQSSDEHVAAIELNDVEYVLQHYGIKGMRWGFRRSPKELARLKNSDGEDVGSVGAKGRAAVTKLRNMRTGEAMVIELEEGSPKVVVKQADGSFKEATMSADAASVLRTTTKDPSEMSTREINEAVNRAQKIEAYNKIFNPVPDPNAELAARVQALQLQSQLAKHHAEMNPSKAKKVATFVNDLKPAFSAFQTMDKAMNHKLSSNLKDMWDAVNTPAPTKAPKVKTKKQKKVKATANFNINPNPAYNGGTGNRDSVFDVSSMGQDDPLNPYIPALGRGSS